MSSTSFSTSIYNKLQTSKPKKSSPLITELIYNQPSINTNTNTTSTTTSNLQLFLTLIFDESLLIGCLIFTLKTLSTLNHQSLSIPSTFSTQPFLISLNLIDYLHHLSTQLHLQLILITLITLFKFIFGLINLTSPSSISSCSYLLSSTATYLIIIIFTETYSQTSQIQSNSSATILSILSATGLLFTLTIVSIIILSSPILWFIHQLIEEEDRMMMLKSKSHPHPHPHPSLIKLSIKSYPKHQPASAISPHKRALITPGF
ncbi:hypothetical protein DFH28DRAFT_419594 [Melampsora americana]|nr:hypothetical protein DFH28DRAFT_419594 [Melampsora americana]